MKRWIADESGKTLVIALIIMAAATLLVSAFLYYVSTSQRVTTAAQEQLTNHYSADAGVEHAIWRLTNETGFTTTVADNVPYVYPITINGQTVNITITLEGGTTSWTDTWSYRDIGDVAAAGSVTYTGDNFTVEGSGRDIWNNSDEFYYVYQPLDGDGEISAQIVSLEHTNWWAKGGVMIRETLDPGSKHAFMAGTPDGSDRVTRTTFQRRLNTGGASSSTHNNSPDPNDPYWVRLVRSGDTFSGYWSTDGTNWTLVGTATISMNTNVYVGMAVTSHNDGTLCTTEFSNVTVTE